MEMSNFDQMYSGGGMDSGVKRKATLWGQGPSGSNVDPDSLLTADEIQAKRAKQETPQKVESASRYEDDIPISRKIYVSGLPPNVTEKPLRDYFSTIGAVQTCNIVRDKTTGISRGFGFVSFLLEADAEAVLNLPQHVFDGRVIRVSPAVPGGDKGKLIKAPRDQWMDMIELPHDQTRIYIGPLDDDVVGSDLQKQFVQFGAIRGVSRLRSSETSVKKSYGFIDFSDAKSMMRAFGSKVFVKGKLVKVALSRFAMEVLLSDTVVFFYDAHLYVDEKCLESYFSQFGQVYRTMHFSDQPTVKDSNGLPLVNRSYGYVDFISAESAQQCYQQRSQLIPPPPGQYVRIGEFLPQVLKYDFMSISERESEKFVKRLEKNVPDQGVWGSCSNIEQILSQVRIPANMVSKLVGERGKTISEICRDSKTKITIPMVKPGEASVILSISGKKDDIKVAQYLMQKTIKGNR